MKTRQIGPGFDVEISDLALNDLRDDIDIEALRQTWMDNKVAVLRDQQGSVKATGVPAQYWHGHPELALSSPPFSG